MKVWTAHIMTLLYRDWTSSRYRRFLYGFMNWVEDKCRYTFVYLCIVTYIYNSKRYQTVYKYSTYSVSLCLYNLVVYAVNKFRRKHAPLINQFFFVTLQESELTHFVPRQILRVVYLLLPNNIFLPPPRNLTHRTYKNQIFGYVKKQLIYFSSNNL